MKTLRKPRSLAMLLGVAATAFACGPTARADTLTWWGTGATANWSDSSNWRNASQVAAVPANGDNLIFAVGTPMETTNDLSGLSAGWLQFPSGNLIFWGNALTLSAGLTNTAGINTLALPLTLGASQDWEITAGAELAFSNTVTLAANALTLSGDGNALFAGALSGAGGSLTKLGAGTLLWAAGNNSLSGGITVRGGTLQAFGGNWATTLFANVTNRLITINSGAILETTTHSLGGLGAAFYQPTILLNGGTWQLDHEQYLTLDNLILQAASQVTEGSPGTGELRSSGGTLLLPNLASGTMMTCGLNMVNAGTINVADGSATDDFTLSGYLTGSASLTKTGAGRFLLSGATANYAANLFINAGTLALGGAALLEKAPLISLASNATFDVSGSWFSINTNQTLAGAGTVLGTVNDLYAPAALSPGGNGTAGTLTMDTLLLAGNLTLNFDLANTPTVGGSVNDLLVITNLSLSWSTPNIVNFNFLNGTPAVGSTYTLIKYTTGPAAGPVASLTATASRYTYAFSSDGSSIKVTITGTPGPLVWKGDGLTNTWDVAGTPNWLNGATKDVFLQGDNATFNDVGSNTPPVNITAAVQPTTVTVNSTRDYTFTGSGRISGGAKLLKSNSGNLTILTANDNTGGGSLSGSGVVTVGNGGTNVANIGSGPLTNNTKVTFFENASVTYPGNMSGNGSLVSFMPGSTLTLTGTNTFTGGLTVANGTVQIGNATPGSSVTGNITNYGTLNLYRSDAFTNQNFITSAGNTLEYGNGDINVRGAGGMTVDGTASISTLPQGALNIGQSASGKLTLYSGGLINIGGNLQLGNPNNAAYYGDVIQNGGTINVGNQVRIGHWGSEISTYTMNGGLLNVPNAQLAVGWDGIGLMTMTNGTVNCRTLNVDDSGATSAINGTNSAFTLSGGQLNIGAGGIGGNTATIKLSGGTIAAAAPAGFSSSMAMILTNGSPAFDSSNSIITLSGVLSGNGGLTKRGAGYLNLNGANTFTGAVSVAQGTLQGTGTSVGPVTVQPGANLSAGGVLSSGTLTLSNLTMNSGAGLIFDLSSTAATGDQLTVKGPLALDSVGTPATLNFLGGVPYTGGPYTLITNWVPRTGSLVLALSGTTRYTATLDDKSNPNRIQVSFSGANASLVWKGNVNSLWDVNADANWLNGSVADKYYQSDAVIFDNTGSSSPNVVLASDMTPASVTVNSAGNYSFSGANLAGVGSLTKSGSGTLTLSNNVNLTGAITVSGGTLQIGNGGTSGYVAGNISDFGSVVFNRSDTVTYGINPVTTGGSTISGSGSLTQAGTGKLVIVSTLNHLGGTTINPGSTLQVGNGAVVDAGSLGNSPAVNNGILIFNRLANNVTIPTPFSGNGAFIFQGTGDAGQSAYTLSATNTFTGPVTLSYARLACGAGAQSFGSPSNISVSPGSQVYATAQPYSSLYNIPLTLAGTGWQDGLGALRIEGNGTWAGNITLAANSRIGVNNASTNTLSGTISGNYELETYGGNAAASLILAPASANSFNALRVSIGAAGAKTIAGNNNAIPNNIPLTMNGGTLWLNGYSKSFSSFFNLNGNSSIQNGSTTSPATVTLTPMLGTSTYNGTFADGASQPLNVTLTQTPGLWTFHLLTANPNWTGNLTNNGGAIVTAGGTSFFGNNNAPNRFLVANNGGSFVWNINNVFGNGVANSFFPTIILNPGSSLSINNYNVIGPVVLNGAALTGNRSAGTSWQMYQFRGPVTVTGSAPSTISNTAGSASNGDHLDTATTFNVADVTANPNSDLIVSVPLLNRSADYGGAGGLVKTGAGTMELQSANTYTGPTIISNGTVKLGPSATLASLNISVGSGATLDVSALPGGLTLAASQVLGGSGTVRGSVTDGPGSLIQPGTANAAGTLTLNSGLTLNGAGSLAIDLANSTASGNDKLVVGGTLTLIPGTPTTVSFNFLNGAPALGTPYTFIQCAAISGTAATAFTNAANSRYTTTFSQSGNSVLVTFTGSPTNLIWTGTDPLAPATWDVATSANWFDGTGANVFYDLDSVRFDDTSVNTTVTLYSTVAPAAITVDSTNNYTISGSGAIAGTASLTKNNTNTLVLGTANAFTGPVNVNAGLLQQDNAGAMPRGANITVASGAQFDFAGQGNDNTRGYNFSIAGSGPDGSGVLVNSSATAIYSYANVSNLTLTADAVIGAASRWDIGPLANSTLNGNGHNLVKLGAGPLDLRPQFITNLASLTVSNGTVYYESYSQTNSSTAATTNYVQPGATLGLYGGLVNNMPVVLDNATIQNQAGNSTPAVWTGNVVISNSSVFNNSGAQFLSGAISGPGAIMAGGGSTTPGAVPGILTLSNINTFAGGTILSNAPVTLTNSAPLAGYAAVVVANPSGLGSGPVTFDLSQMTTNAMTNVARVLEFNVPAGSIVPNAINLPTSGVTNVTIQGRNSTSIFTLSGQISGGHSSLTNWFDFPAGAPGVIRLDNAANNFQASTIYVPRGELAITGGGCLGNGGNLLKLDHGLTAVTGVGGLRFDAPTVTVSQNILASSGTALDLFGDNNGDGVPDSTNTVTLNGVLSGAGLIYVRGTNGTLILGGNNTYTGNFELQQPVTLQVGASANLGPSAYVAIKAGSTFRYTGAGSETMTRNLWMDQLGGGTIDVPSATAALTWNPAGGGISAGFIKTGAGALILGGANVINGGMFVQNGGSLTVNSVIGGSATVVQVNAGTLTLNGANTCNGGTFVNPGGTLFVNGSLPTANTVAVGTGGALGGTGAINCPVTIAPGATLAPGVNAIGKLTVNNTLNLAGTTLMEINGTTGANDSLAGMPTVTYGGTLNVSNLGATPAPGAKFTLFSAANRLGSFAAVNLPELTAPLAWNNLLAVDGSIVVVSNSTSITPVYVTNAVSGTNLVLTWPADHTGWNLLVQTNNLNLGISSNPADWTPVSGSASTNQVWLPIDATKPTEFYRLVSP